MTTRMDPCPSTPGPSKQSPSSPEQSSNNTSTTCNPTTYKPTSNYSVVPHEQTNPTISLVQTGNHGSEPPAKHWKKRGRPASFGHEASGNVVKQVREQFVTHTKQDFPVPSTILHPVPHYPPPNISIPFGQRNSQLPPPMRQGMQPYYQRAFNVPPSPGVIPRLAPSEVKYMKLTPNAVDPTSMPTGLELSSAYTYGIHSHENVTVKTDLHFDLEYGIQGRIFPIPNSIVTRHVDIFPTVVPYSYRGNVQISVSNYTDEAYVIHQGAVVAQMILTQVYHPILMQVSYIPNKYF